VAWLSSTTALQGDIELARLLVVDSHYAIGATRCKLGPIGLVVNSEQLIELVMDRMQELSTGSVPVLEGAVSVD
jgi:hypothetical protein